jgi:hypothetical protein
MSESAALQDDFPKAFESAFAGLQILIEEACAAQREWPPKVAAAVRVGMLFAAADPAAAQLLTNDALAGGREGIVRHERLIAYLREGLAPGRHHGPDGDRLPAITELTPYLGADQARRIGAGQSV